MNKKKLFVDLFICLILVSLIFLPSINHPWLFYDERMIEDETYLPIPKSFKEISEIISSFGISNNLGSSNFLYSSNQVNRFNLLAVPLALLVFHAFQKTTILYHLFLIGFHILNIFLVYFLIKTSLCNFTTSNRILSILLTMLWALHPAQAESVLLTTNFSALISYLIFFLLFLDFIKNKEKNISLRRIIVLPLCFLLPMLVNEYIVTLPLIFTVYSLIDNLRLHNIKSSMLITLKQTLPYLIGFFLYSIYFILSSYEFYQPTLSNPLILALERILWLSPQVFFHYIKLVLFPINLSIDQSAFIHLGRSLFDPYAVFCLVFLLLWLFIPLILFLRNKKTYPLLFLSWLFFISLLPFSQFLSPTYCLASERYLYLPLFFVVFGIGKLRDEYFDSTKQIKYLITGGLTLLVLLCACRTYLRTNDWKDSITLIKATIKSSPNNLYKGFRINTLAQETAQYKLGSDTEVRTHLTKAQNYFYKALRQYTKARKKYNHEPLILKSYGLDYNSLIIKCIHLVSFRTLIDPQDNYYKKYLELFKPHLIHIENFNLGTLELYANLLVKNNNIEEAKKIFLYAYEKSPLSPFILVSLLRFSRDIENNLISTKKYLTEALKLYPYSKEILFEALRYYQMENNLPEYTRYSYLHGLRTHSAFFYREALAGYLQLKDFDNAKKTTNKLLALDIKDPESLYLSSIYYIRTQDFNKAIELLNEALKYSGDNNTTTDKIKKLLSDLKSMTQNTR